MEIPKFQNQPRLVAIERFHWYVKSMSFAAQPVVLKIHEGRGGVERGRKEACVCVPFGGVFVDISFVFFK